jgi:serine/threonine protein kinase
MERTWGVDAHEFLEQLRASQLFSQEQLAGIALRATGDMPADAVGDLLLEARWVTPFQLERMRAGRASSLALGQYRLLGELGEGGFGCVYQAKHAMMDRTVAIKVISPHLVESPKARKWFRREVLANTPLHHPNIVMAFDANEVDDVLYLVMEYVDGSNLDVLVREHGPLSFGLACAMLHQIGRALQYAHEKGMVHRDIKPANLLIPKDAAALFVAETGGRHSGPLGNGAPLVKVADFGLARLQQSADGNTLTVNKENGFVGTPDYISPEQARDVHEVDTRSDLYSLGCTFYYALTGVRPFKGHSALEIVMQHMEKEPEPLERHRPEIPLALAGLVRRLMAKKPERRFQTAADMLAELAFLFGSFALPMPPIAAIAPSAQQPDPVAPVTPVGVNPPPFHGAGAGEDLPRTAVSAHLAPADDGGGRQQQTDDSASLPARPLETRQGTVDAPTAAPSALNAGFVDVWKMWTMVVASFARHDRFEVSDAGYVALHHRLLEACRACAGQCSGSARALFERAHKLAAPWLTRGALAAIDQETLLSLVRRCRELDRELGIDSAGKSRRPWLIAAALMITTALVYWVVATRPAFTRTVPLLNSVCRFVENNSVLFLAAVLPAVGLGLVYCFLHPMLGQPERTKVRPLKVTDMDLKPRTR